MYFFHKRCLSEILCLTVVSSGRVQDFFLGLKLLAMGTVWYSNYAPQVTYSTLLNHATVLSLHLPNSQVLY